MAEVHAPDSEASVSSLLLDRLASSHLPDLALELLFAALIGDDLSAVLDGAVVVRPSRGADPMVQAEPAGTYLKAIVVEGFRGIGPRAALRLTPGPGLTLVIGRNGSGKSSFAEAAELALTGDNRRWLGRSAVWRDGWRNLHQPERAEVRVELAVDGQPGTSTVVREWPRGAELRDGTAFVQQPGMAKSALPALGWTKALDLYRPFLSYAELGALVDGKPSEMYDALQAILGLDRLLGMEDALAGIRKELDQLGKLAAAQLPALLQLLGSHADPRARQAEALLKARKPDLDALARLAVAEDGARASAVEPLQQLIALALPDGAQVQAALDELAASAKAVRDADSTPAGDARRVAELLEIALAHHSDHPGQPCPVCGGRPLDHAWAGHASAEVARLREVARDSDTARQRNARALLAVRSLLGPIPPVMTTTGADGVDVEPAASAWQRWAALTNALDVADHVEALLPAFDGLRGAVANVQQAARDALARRTAAWQPAATALAAWVQCAAASQKAKQQLDDVKQAESWLKAAGQDIRNQRLEPFAALSAAVWQQLRQESNVDLGPIQLEGASTRRRVTLDVTVDGVPGAALSVMSQGELHALGLALFLPRATASDSPFRFLVIDDPVQSMDPAKVDGLARVLADVARTRQVVVFTHDDRLPQAVRGLQLPATIWEVTRRENSQVEVMKNDDPVIRCLDDARALAQAGELSQEARAVVVAGFCRTAIEAACHAKVRTDQLHAGTPHAEIERRLASAQTLHTLLALTLFGDPTRGNEVTPRLRALAGADAARAFQTAKSGTHQPYAGDLMTFIADTEHLAEKLQP